MEPIILKDPAVKPSDEIVFSFIGEKKNLWEQLINLINEHTDLTGEWRYYNDGKSWLFRGLKKEKAVFWVSVYQSSFSVTFYLSGKAEPLIESSDLPQKLKNEYESTKEIKFRYISIPMISMEDIESVKKLIKIKLKIK